MRLTNSELKRYLVKWFLVGIAGGAFLVGGIKLDSTLMLIGAGILFTVALIGFLANLVVFIKRKIKGESS